MAWGIQQMSLVYFEQMWFYVDEILKMMLMIIGFELREQIQNWKWN